MAFDAQGNWEPEDDSVTKQLGKVTAQGGQLMQQAQTTGMKMANRRGLLNSSMAVEAAQGEAYKAAIPLASQQAQQIGQKNLQHMQGQTQKDVAAMNIAAHDRQYAMGAVTEMEKKYGAMFSEILKNNDLSAAARNKYYQHIQALRQSDLNLVEQIYGIDLDWAAPTATHG